MIDISKTYSTKNDGDIVIIDYINAGNIKVMFVKTGFILTTRSCQIKKGEIKDKMKPSVAGIGFIGDGIHKATKRRAITKAYQVWSSMIRRCYSEKALLLGPTYRDVKVCDAWHNFQNFSSWFAVSYIYGCELDKDILMDGNKIYSPETCLFVTKPENIIKATAKKYNFISPKGVLISIFNLSEFCRLQGLSQPNMSAVSNGRDKSYKGWTSNCVN